jgi:4a-hydroxytetrahydrobiopterin dehydratase
MNPFTEKEIAEKLADHPGWALNEEGQIARTFTFKNFAQVLLFANAVGYLAEQADHHPNLFIHDYKYLTISLMSHDAGGVTERDFALAGQIDEML